MEPHTCLSVLILLILSSMGSLRVVIMLGTMGLAPQMETIDLRPAAADSPCSLNWAGVGRAQEVLETEPRTLLSFN